ncbi:MAG: NAD(P)-dependent oxidoreductase [Gemmatimonadaceae bacterium]
MTRIAFLGTGLLGAALAEAAAKRGGSTITAWNRTAAKAEALAPFGITAAPSPAEAVRGAERVHLVLKDDAVVEEIIAEARAGLEPGAIIVDHSTTQPALTAERARRLNAEGVHYLHCPVFIGPAAARAGQGTILAAGPQALFDRVKGDLARMATRLEYFGERPDLAATFKLIGNATFLGLSGLTADLFAIAQGAGLPPADALRILDFFNPASVMTGRGTAMLGGDFTPGFELAMARKDVRLMMETAGKRPLAVLPGLAARMDAVIAQGHGADDFTIIGRQDPA